VARCVQRGLSLQAIAESMQQLPGVDVNNPELQAAIAEAARQMGNGEGDKDAEDEGQEDQAADGGGGSGAAQ
jgi:hypothetical protein